jgi:hypothetical protein
MNIVSPLILEDLIKDSDAVVYFTHDYFSEVIDKNDHLLQTVDMCKAYNIKKVIAVNPLEYINYFNDDGFKSDPYKEESITHDEAM